MIQDRNLLYVLYWHQPQMQHHPVFIIVLDNMPIITKDHLFDCGELSEFLEQRRRNLDNDIKMKFCRDAVTKRLYERYSLEPVQGCGV